MNLDKNKEKFEQLRELKLPLGEYSIISSGPLGIRNIREMNDIDLIVSDTLWEELSKEYGVTLSGHIQKIMFPGVDIEAFCQISFDPPLSPSIPERIAQSEIIDGLPFEPLPLVILFKKMMNREKDLKDILLIEAWLQKKAQS